MAFQWVFDKAEQIAVDKRQVVGQTVTRNQAVRAVSRGPGIYKFTVNMPSGMRYSIVKDNISALDAANTFTVENIQLNNPGYSDWLQSPDLAPGQSWNVICVSMPNWNIFQRDQVEWDGPFVFYESIV